MVASQRFSKGGSSAFLKTLKGGGRSDRRGGISELVPVMEALQGGPRATDDLAQHFPGAERLIAGLISDGMIEACDVDSGKKGVKLTPYGQEFLKRRTFF